jgi:hypothetical protein
MASDWRMQGSAIPVTHVRIRERKKIVGQIEQVIRPIRHRFAQRHAPHLLG